MPDFKDYNHSLIQLPSITFEMKKYFVLSAIVLLFAVISCAPENKNDGENGGNQNNPDELTITGEALNVTDCSATLTGYANLPFELGDAEVGIMYDKNQSFGDAKKAVATGLDGNNKFTVTATGLEPSTTYFFKSYVQNGMAVKYGAVKSFTTSFFPVESVSLDKTEYTFNAIGNTLTLQATVLPADATDKSVSWTSDKDAVATVDDNGKVTATGNGTATITVKTKDQEKTANCEITVAQWVTSITLSDSSLTLNEGQEQTLTATVNPTNANDPSLTWTSSDENIAKVDQAGKVTAVSKGTATIKAEAKDGSGKYATCSVTVKKPLGPCPSGAVDLGLSVYWATTNLGASKPEEYGDYYAWGEINPYYSSQDPLTWKDEKTGYNWASYKWCNGSPRTLTKYNTSSYYGTVVDNKTVLYPEDDVAHVKLAGNWRMPTDAEWSELLTKCTWTWTTNYNGTGVSGRIVTASNGNSIFLPAAGSRSDTYLGKAGSYGFYWSSSLYTDQPLDAWYVYFYSDSVRRYPCDRCFGPSVRPVSD